MQANDCDLLRRYVGSAECDTNMGLCAGWWPTTHVFAIVCHFHFAGSQFVNLLVHRK